MPYTDSRHSLVYIKNIDKKPLEVKWGGVQQAVLQAGEILPFPAELAEHAARTLISRLLIRAGKKPNNEKFIAELRSKIVVTEKTFSTRKPANEDEKLAEEVQQLHKQERAKHVEVEETDDDDDDGSLPTRELKTTAKSHLVLKKKNRVEETEDVEVDEPAEEEIEMAQDEEAEEVDMESDDEDMVVDEDSEEEAVQAEVDENADLIEPNADTEEVQQEIKAVQKFPTRQELYDYAAQNGINTQDPKMFNYLESLGVRDLIREIDYPLDSE